MGLFVHVPGTEIVSVEDMARALEICLRTAI